MATSSTHLEIDGRSCLFQEPLSEAAANYHMDRSAVVRKDLCIGTKGGLMCSSYGTTPLATMQSQRIQGYTVAVSACGPQPADLSDPLFQLTNQAPRMPGTCSDQSMTPIYTRQPHACDSISETDTTSYAFFPANFQAGYMGYSPIIGTDMQSRRVSAALYDGMKEENGILKPCVPQKRPCDSYGDYGMNSPYVPYA